MSRNVRIILLILIVFLASFLFVKKYFSTPQFSIKDLQVQTLSGEDVDVKTLKGKVVVLNFWATWCMPCIQEMPMFANMAKIYKDKDVIFILASDEELDKIGGFLEKEELGLPVYQLKNRMKDYDVFTIPATFIFDKKGHLVNTKRGAFETAEELRQIVNSYL
ncbi:MAG: TlpA family protein disulfide reductase [Chitinophagales bacterium]|nr:TlpA family protein disulfide reductase [Chitinophagales bacterium]